MLLERFNPILRIVYKKILQYNLLIVITWQHKRTGRVSFRGGGGGGEVSCPNIFVHCLHENQVVLPEYYLIFWPKMAFWKILAGGGGGGGDTAP